MPVVKKSSVGAKAAVEVATSALKQGLARAAAAPIRRRSFLLRAGLTAGAAGLARHLPFNVIEPAQAQAAKAAAAAAPEIKHTVCTHCAVGCSVEAVVQNGVWIRQEPAFDSPFNMGAHCAKGASVREHGHGEHRLRYPMKLVAGKYVRISWEQAINESGRPAYWQAAHRNPGPIRDHDDRRLQAQQRASLSDAQVGGLDLGHQQLRSPGSYLPLDHRGRRRPDLRLRGDDQLVQRPALTASAVMFIGSNPAEAHPISMLHALHAKESLARS